MNKAAARATGLLKDPLSHRRTAAVSPGSHMIRLVDK
jgi:hypothetical protein